VESGGGNGKVRDPRSVEEGRGSGVGGVCARWANDGDAFCI
jgi:hypothetical protein